jgi:hypothetical protein
MPGRRCVHEQVRVPELSPGIFLEIKYGHNDTSCLLGQSHRYNVYISLITFLLITPVAMHTNPNRVKV